MKKLYKEYTLTAGGGTLTLKANALNDYYLINGGAVTLTSGLTIATDVASKNNVIRIYWLQDTTIGGGGSITILGNNVPINIIGGIMFTCVYNGTTWDVFQTSAENYEAATLELSNIAYVNYDITTDDTAKRVFKTYADAVSYISGLGTATTNNHWTIKLPSGYCDEAITLKAYIDVQGAAGTKIKSVVSSVAFVSDNVYDSVVYDCAITTAYVAEAKTANFVRCTFKNIKPVLGAGAGQLLITDSIIKSADFSNSESIYDWSGNKFYATDGNILMSGITHNVKDSEIVAHGGNNVSLPDSMINCFISVPTITTTRATSIAGGKVVATTINAGADLSLLNTDIGAANLTMADATVLTTNVIKSSGTVTLDGTATKAELGASWNDGIATGEDSTAFNAGIASGVRAVAWNTGTASDEAAVAFNQGVASNQDSVAWNYADVAGQEATGWNGGIASGREATAFNYATASGQSSVAWNEGTATAYRAVAWNYGTANGYRSTAVGTGVVAQSYLETAVGQYNTNGAAASTNSWNTADKLWSVGNGTSDIARNDALVILKNGKATASAEWTFDEAPIVGTSTEAAAEALVGKIRYRSDANNSWCEMVMQTGAATWAWVVIKTNNW
jgi:hypothetical protein